jgi:glycosyltransferase involved in cell wall biosynthesis
MNVNVIYHHYPHYRAPVMRELVRHGRHEYRFWGSLSPQNGIETFEGDDIVSIRPLHFAFYGKYWRLRGYWPAVLDRSADAVLLLATPNMAASWCIGIAARIIGKKVLFWCHGWLRKEPPLKRLVRNCFYRLADSVLVYNERSKNLGVESGFPANRIVVIYNSLDFERSQCALEDIRAGISDRPQDRFDNPSRPLVICSARLTSLCRFDLLLTAAKELEMRGMPINILLIGDGPERNALEKMAISLGISVQFFGACYDEAKLGNMIYWADLLVSPGKIGLAAIHSLTYGTPVITHGDMDRQMPEAESIEPGVTGLFFDQGDASDLAAKIQAWLIAGHDRVKVRQMCRNVVAKNWNPKAQRILIDQAISNLAE